MEAPVILFVQALFLLSAYNILNLVYSFQTIYSMARGWKVNTKIEGSDVINEVCTAVNYACVWYPKHALCLQRSFVTTYLLRKHGFAAQIVLGAQKMPFKAHAWVEIDGCAVNEKLNVQATYAIWDRS
jgi:hypothetical protein